MRIEQRVFEQIILDHIPTTPNGSTAPVLASELGITKRTLRRTIHILREKGYRIKNQTDGGGYYIEKSS